MSEKALDKPALASTKHHGRERTGRGREAPVLERRIGLRSLIDP